MLHTDWIKILRTEEIFDKIKKWSKMALNIVVLLIIKVHRLENFQQISFAYV